jgi:O-antigen ligase
MLGVGPDQFPRYYLEYAERVGIRVKNADREAHNLYLDIAADLGLAGLLVFLALNATALRSLVRVRRRTTDPDLRGLATALILSIAAYLVSGLFLHFSFVRYYWLFVAFAATVVSVAERPPPPAWAEPE